MAWILKVDYSKKSKIEANQKKGYGGEKGKKGTKRSMKEYRNASIIFFVLLAEELFTAN